MTDLTEKQKEREQIQASYFTVRLYVETDDYDIGEVLARIADYDRFAYCLHDQDVKKDGSPDKPHYHAVFRDLDDKGEGVSTTIGAVARRLKISSANVQAGRNENENRGFKGCVRYLIHDTQAAKKDKKFLYKRSSIVANFDLDSVFGVDGDMYRMILDHVLKDRPKSFTELFAWCCDNHCVKEFLKSQYAWRTIMFEVKANEV